MKNKILAVASSLRNKYMAELNPDKDIDRIFFVHIPRTGGTTIERIMKEKLSGKFFDGYWDGAIIQAKEKRICEANYFIGHNFYCARAIIPEAATVLRTI